MLWHSKKLWLRNGKRQIESGNESMNKSGQILVHLYMFWKFKKSTKKSTLSFRIEHKNYIKFVYQSNFALLYLITFLISPMKYLILNLVDVLLLIWLVFIEVFDAAGPSLLEKFCVCDSVSSYTMDFSFLLRPQLWIPSDLVNADGFQHSPLRFPSSGHTVLEQSHTILWF